MTHISRSRTGRAISVALSLAFLLMLLNPCVAAAQPQPQVLESGIRIEPRSFRPYMEAAKIGFSLKRGATIQLEVVEAETDRVVFSEGHYFMPGHQSILWKAADTRGILVPEGRYRFRLLSEVPTGPVVLNERSRDLGISAPFGTKLKAHVTSIPGKRPKPEYVKPVAWDMVMLSILGLGMGGLSFAAAALDEGESDDYPSGVSTKGRIVYASVGVVCTTAGAIILKKFARKRRELSPKNAAHNKRLEIQLREINQQVDAYNTKIRESVRVELRPPVTVPLTLASTVSFTELSGEGFLNAEEEGTLLVNVVNSGPGVAYDISVNLSPEAVPHLTYAAGRYVSEMAPGEQKEIRVPIRADRNVASREVSFTVEVKEGSGFDAPPVRLVFNTKAFEPPELAVDVGIEDTNGNGLVDLGEQIDVTVRVWNRGTGGSKSVKATVEVAGENIYYPSDTSTFELGDIAAGGSEDFTFKVLTNTRFSETALPISVRLEEATGEFGSVKPLDIPVNQPVRPIEEVVIPATEVTIPHLSEVALTPDVEIDIPEAREPNPNAVAVVIGIKDYLHTGVPEVPYARRDARVVRDYLVTAMGYDASNILPRNPDELMTAGQMKTLIRQQLPAFVRQGQSDVFVYYSGHGAPHTGTREAFFVPCDCNPNFVSTDNAYSLNEFYLDLSKIEAKSLTVVIDACFSGAAGDGRMLIGHASPVIIVVENPVVPILARPRTVVLLSSGGDQVSNWYPEKRHGMFTYFFLKGLKGEADFNDDRKITAGEIEQYIQDDNSSVPYWSRREFQRTQVPQVHGDKGRVLVEYR